MKNLLFNFTLTILILFTIGIQTTNAQIKNTKTPSTIHTQFVTGYFTMTISAGYEDNTTQCFIIELSDFNLLDSNDTVGIMDQQGNEYQCDISQTSCTIDWCYEKRVEEQRQLIQCLVIDGGTGSVLLLDGCIITIEPI